MKKLFAVAALSLGLASLAQAAPMPKGDAAAGQGKAAACGACHGADGNSMAPTFPRLAGQNARYTFKQLQDFKAGRRMNPTMQGMAAPLSEQDMADLAAFYADQKSGAGMAKAELAKKGEKIYRGGNSDTGLAACAGCHNPAGKGNAPAGFPRVGGQHADYIKAQLQAFRAAGRNDTVADPAQKRVNDAAKAGELGPMQMVAAKLSDEEIEAVSSFISGLH
ncbi:MAG: cytochrome c4 [Moraxellaceae bacterium]|jgi:cytochrome c553|nr:cytochrome c4 [Moraxellaceae bacterium]